MAKTAAELENFAKTLVDRVKGGNIQSFEEFLQQNPQPGINGQEYRDAVIIAESLAAAEWGFGPRHAQMRVSRDVWETFSGQEQVEFISRGGTLYELEQPKVQAEPRVLTNKRGERMLQAEFDKLEPKARMDWCTATS